MNKTILRAVGVASLAIAMLDCAGFGAFAEPAAQRDAWPQLANDIFGGRPLADGTGLLDIEMPSRAEDAAIVPLTVRATLATADTRRVKAFTIVIDENPAPVAATFSIGSSSIVSSISTRVRVNSYTNVHAVAELSDGKLYVVKTYVKASGGCSAPAVKNADKAGFGQMRFRQFAQSTEAAAINMREAQIMIRHPNNSGLQMDQVTRLYIPAFFVRSLKIWQGDELVLAMDGSISISEDPNVRFTYAPNDSPSLRVEAIDTQDQVFKGQWLVGASGMERVEGDN
jgi:sulfur-oxidizing protein SoxY